jgi:hypothetical protein
MAIARMHELRSLQLINNRLSNQGLVAILDNCLHLKSLYILNCYNIDMTPQLEARIKVKKLLMNHSSDRRWDDFDESGSHMSECSTCLNYFGLNEERYQKHYAISYFGPNEERQRASGSAIPVTRRKAPFSPTTMISPAKDSQPSLTSALTLSSSTCGPASI